jgi:hypothetical protein
MGCETKRIAGQTLLTKPTGCPERERVDEISGPLALSAPRRTTVRQASPPGSPWPQGSLSAVDAAGITTDLRRVPGRLAFSLGCFGSLHRFRRHGGSVRLGQRRVNGRIPAPEENGRGDQGGDCRGHSSKARQAHAACSSTWSRRRRAPDGRARNRHGSAQRMTVPLESRAQASGQVLMNSSRMNS